MANPNYSEKSNALDREENITRGGLSAKRVALYRYDSSTDTLLPGDIPIFDIRNISPADDPEIATYKYFGFQERGGTNWRIMRKTIATKAFTYATGTSGYSTAWTNKSSGSYS